MKRLILASTAIIALAFAPAHATQIISFGQISPNNTITATTNGANTITTLGSTNTAVLITELFGAVTPPAIPALFNFSAISIDAATSVGPALLQHYSGSFCVSSGSACSGTIDLQGSFVDAAFGLANGPQLSINIGNPPDSLTLSSSVINAADLLAPNSFTLSLSNIPTPLGLHVAGTTIAPFTASFSGVASASPSAVPEPASLVIMGMGALGLGLIRARKLS